MPASKHPTTKPEESDEDQFASGESPDLPIYSGPQILDEAEDVVYGRDGQYGSPEDNFATIAEFWNTYIEAAAGVNPGLEPIDVAYMMVELKIARASNGEYNRDNDVDIAGYAENAARIAGGGGEP